ncbi:MAG TPA: AMP-binding protein, partial [Micromonosporaceae bacterium]
MTGTTNVPAVVPADLAGAAVAAVLRTTTEAVRAARSLFDLPGFDSVAIVAVLDRLEEELGVQIPAELIVPETFETLGSLAAVLRRALDGAGSPQPSAAGATADGPILLHHLLDRCAATSPHSVALVRQSGAWSYRDLAGWSQHAARWLAGLGVGRGDRVVLIGHNEAWLVPLLFATSRVGAVAVPLSDQVRPYHLRHILTDCAPRLIVGNDTAVASCRPLTEVPVRC